MATTINSRAIASFSSLPETTIHAISENPTQELVKSLLEAIEVKAKEFEQFKSQKVKLEVELETHVRTSESKVKVLQNSRDKALSDVSKLRVDVQNAEDARSRVETELEHARQSTSHENTEIVTLKSRIASLEASSRDTLVVLDSKTSAYDRLSQELSTQHSKAVDLRKQVSTLEQANQNASAAVASAKFREQSLQQELDLQKKNNEWLENERRIKSEEHTTFRKDKNARISELTQSNERYIEDAETARRAEAAMKSRFDEQIRKNEELLVQLQRLQEKEVTEVESHRIELDALSRLAELQKQSADTAKQRVQELAMALEEMRDEASAEIGRVRAEVESEHQDRVAAEQRVVELESRVAELEQEISESRVQPSTPRRDMNGTGISTPLRPGTPVGIFTPGSTTKAKTNLTVSQLYGEYKKLEKELASERRINEQLQSNMDSMLEDLEANKPEIEELRLEQERLQTEVQEMSTAAEQTNDERATALKETRILQGQYEALAKELEACQQSLRDRNSQLRWLIMDREARVDGDSISEDQFSRLQQAAREADERDSAHLSDSQRIVNQKLVLFKDVQSLQEQNQNQLATIRNLVDRLDNVEARQMEQENVKLKKDLENAFEDVARYQDEIKSMISQSKSFVQERDMFRNMLSRRGHLPANIDPVDFSRSMPLPSGAIPTQDVDSRSEARKDNDYVKLLKDLQAHFDNYRQESATDNSALKTQINDISKRNSNLQIEASKLTGQLSAANQRCEMLQANYDMLKTEAQEIKKRSDLAMENAAKQDSRVQQAAEELVEARGLLESLRRESANLKAEKDLWKNVEARLRDDSETLRNERSRLDALNASLQNLLNEREQVDAETRRRLQTQVEMLETELQTSKRKLNDELEDSKKTALRREYEHEQSQKRVDDLVTSLSNYREELAAAKTARDHLQARVDELTIELRSAEERLEVFTRPPAETEGHANGTTEESLTREQELTIEVSELKRDVELRTAEVDRANEQVEVYQGIAQSAEERLQELSETNTQYREETESILTEKDARITDLEQRVEEISSELSDTNSELSTLRTDQAEVNRKLDEQKALHDAEIARLKDSEERMAEQAQFNLEASQVQAQIATEAQQNYEKELVKHAEAAQSLQAVRSEVNQIKLEIAGSKTEAAHARSDLEQKESSWAEQKERYERELTDLKRRREEIVQQNSILHGQLEALTQQIAAVQRDRAVLTDTEALNANGDVSESRTDLQEVINYLRREKEIIEVQYHLSSQEQKRFRQQVDFLQSQLDDTRLKLEQQRRANADSERDAMSHAKLMDTLNELNLFRESSVTLRAEAKQASQALVEKTKKVQELTEQIQPLQERIAELENLVELRDGEMKLLQEDRDHWQQRCQNILSKYDRVDPAELESLKTRLTELETERDAALSSQSDLQAQIDRHPEVVETARSDLRGRLSEQFKARSKELSGKIKEKQAELDIANAEKASLETELNGVKEQLVTAQEQISSNASKQITEETAGNPQNEADSLGTNERTIVLESRVSELETSLEAKNQEIATMTSQQEDRFKARETQLKEILNKRMNDLKQSINAAKQTALDELRSQLTAEHEKEVEKLRAQPTPAANEPQQNNAEKSVSEPTAAAPTFESIIESLTDAQARYVVQNNETVRAIVKHNIRNAVQKAKDSMQQEMAGTPADTEQPPTTNGEVGSNVEEIRKQYEADKAALLKEKEEEFSLQKELMIKEFDQKLESERQAIIAQKDKAFAEERLEFSAESERKIAEQVANAQALAEKRGAVKYNMSESRSKTAQAKLDIVKTAAEQTPEKPVKEVWDIAKDAKPVAQSSAKPTIAPPTGMKPVAPLPTTAAAQPTTQATAPSTLPPVAESITQPTPSFGESNASADEGVANGTEPSEAKDANVNASLTHEVSLPTSTPDVDNKSAAPNAAGAGQGSGRQAPQSNIPQPRGGAFRGGRGGSGIPQPQTGNHGQQTQPNRGSGIPRGGRGGGRAGGRAGAQNVQNNNAGGGNRGGSTNSPSRGGAGGSGGGAGALNPNAQQFTPTSAGKRAREESDGGDGGLGKRIRGGGAGSS